MKVIACNMVSPSVSCGIGKSTPAPKYENTLWTGIMGEGGVDIKLFD